LALQLLLLPPLLLRSAVSPMPALTRQGTRCMQCMVLLLLLRVLELRISLWSERGLRQFGHGRELRHRNV